MRETRREMILIVEDDAGVALLEQRRLERVGYDVITAATAEEALRRLRQRHVDLILLDYNLPGDADGLDFYAQVRAAGFDPPVILVTGFSNEATVIRALRTGVRDFVTKSVEYLDYLPEAVNRVLRQVRTEHQLAESETRLASIIDSAKDAIIVVEADQRISLFNPAAEEMFRCPASQALGQRLCRFIPREYSPGVEENGKDEAGGASLAHHVRAGSHGLRADGQEFPLEASVSPAAVGERRFYTVVARDITQKKKLEEQLLHSQRMEGIGQLAGGIAHDFNNLLTVINGYCDILLLGADAAGAEHPMLLEVRKAGERAAGLTRQLLAFGRKQILAPVVLDLNFLVTDIEKMLHRLIGEDIHLTSSLDPNLGKVRADPGQLEQVLMNLAVNARDAMPQGGRLTIETRNVRLGEAASSQLEIRPGCYALLAVTDTGCGMDEATKAHIFEPFFTTKAVGKGTGLGLATVYGIVKQSDGCIDVASEVGRGTTFKVYLPQIKEVVTVEQMPLGPYELPKGTETILLAEDEEGVRSLARIALQSLGYSVLEGQHGKEAVELCQQHAGPIHLLLTDVVMPQMSGRELAECVTRARPGLKVLYLSGYTDDAIVRHGVLEAGIAFLQKPFTPATLARKVRNILDGREASADI